MSCQIKSSVILQAGTTPDAELCEQFPVFDCLPCHAATGCFDNSRQLGQRQIKVIVDNNIIEFGCMPDLFIGSLNPLFYDIPGVLSTPDQPFFQCRNRWGQNEHADGFGKQFADLSRSLPVYFQQSIVAGVQLAQYGQF